MTHTDIDYLSEYYQLLNSQAVLWYNNIEMSMIMYNESASLAALRVNNQQPMNVTASSSTCSLHV
jgi:hypothetical protein